MSPSGFARLSLALTGLVFGGFGVALFVSPDLLATVGVEIARRPAGAVELRAFYGGLELGMAAFFLLAAAREAWHRPGLFVQVLALGGAGAGPAPDAFSPGERVGIDEGEPPEVAGRLGERRRRPPPGAAVLRPVDAALVGGP